MNFGLIIIFSLVFLLLAITKRCKSYDERLALCYVVLTSIIIGLRTSTPDTKGYLEFYEKITPGDWLSMAWYYLEPGFQILTHIIKLLFGYRPVIYLSFISLFTGLLVFDATRRILKQNTTIKSTWIKCPLTVALVFFYSYYGLFYSAITIRAGIAFGFFLEILSLFITGLNRKRLFISLILFTLAFFFHSSSILMLPILGIYYWGKSFSKRSYLLLLVIATTIYFSRLNLLLINSLSSILERIMIDDSSSITRVGTYTSSVHEVDFGLSYKYMLQLILGYILLGTNTKKLKYYKIYNIYFLGIIMGAFLAPISMAYRVLDYFYVVGYILIIQSFLFKHYDRNYYFGLVGIILFQILLVYRVCYA